MDSHSVALSSYSYVDPNQPDEYGLTSIHWAADRSSDGLPDLLHNHGADPSAFEGADQMRMLHVCRGNKILVRLRSMERTAMCCELGSSLKLTRTGLGQSSSAGLQVPPCTSDHDFGSIEK